MKRESVSAIRSLLSRLELNKYEVCPIPDPQSPSVLSRDIDSKAGTKAGLSSPLQKTPMSDIIQPKLPAVSSRRPMFDFKGISPRVSASLFSETLMTSPKPTAGSAKFMPLNIEDHLFESLREQQRIFVEKERKAVFDIGESLLL